MRLLDARSMNLHEFFSEAPEYAILSHTWVEGEEVTFQEMTAISRARKTLSKARKAFRLDSDECRQVTTKSGFTKILKCCQKALALNIQYVWIDTCCINKENSAELSEAINSMYRWYADSVVCFTHLADLPSSAEVLSDPSPLSSCRWFSRGWCLQELLAPRSIHFFASDWVKIGSFKRVRSEDNNDEGFENLEGESKLAAVISKITKINKAVLFGDTPPLSTYSIAQRMSWASGRQTSRVEDQSYCLLGIFGVNIPLLYGEGDAAFLRLQKAILEESDDQSIFAWDSSTEYTSGVYSGLLAGSPKAFANASQVVRLDDSMLPGHKTYQMTNRGLRITLRLLRLENPASVVATLGCAFDSSPTVPLCVRLAEPWTHEDDFFGAPRENLPRSALSFREVDGVYRWHTSGALVSLDTIDLEQMHFTCIRQLYVSQKLPPLETRQVLPSPTEFWYLREWPEELHAAIERTSPPVSGYRGKQRATIPAKSLRRIAVWFRTQNHGYFLLLLRRTNTSLLACYMISTPTLMHAPWEPDEVLWKQCVSSTSYCPLASSVDNSDAWNDRPQPCVRAELRLSERKTSTQFTLSLHKVDLRFAGDGLAKQYPNQGLALGYKHSRIPAFWVDECLRSSEDASVTSEDVASRDKIWETEHIPMLRMLKHWRREMTKPMQDGNATSSIFGEEKDAYLGDFYIVKEILDGRSQQGFSADTVLMNQLSNAEWLHILTQKPTAEPPQEPGVKPTIFSSAGPPPRTDASRTWQQLRGQAPGGSPRAAPRTWQQLRGEATGTARQASPDSKRWPLQSPSGPDPQIVRAPSKPPAYEAPAWWPARTAPPDIRSTLLEQWQGQVIASDDSTGSSPTTRELPGIHELGEAPLRDNRDILNFWQERIAAYSRLPFPATTRALDGLHEADEAFAVSEIISKTTRTHGLDGSDLAIRFKAKSILEALKEDSENKALDSVGSGETE